MQSLVTISTVTEQNCHSYKNHLNSCICTASNILDGTYQMPLSHLPMWLTLSNHFPAEQTLPLIKGKKHLFISAKTHLTKQQLLLWRFSIDDLRRSAQCLLKISLRTKSLYTKYLGLNRVLGAILNSQLASSKHCHFLERINYFSFS